ncbi:MAG TPA: proton-conducting transporter membrane subunit [Candidatus Limnocylindrales bacterium]|nr:proton-conducting transporter membrane subunit [Candidatus Limnocylindrales bacterium]
MSLLPFLAVTFGAGALSLLIRRPRPSAIVGIAGLVASVVLALTIQRDEPFSLAGGSIAGSDYARLFLALGAAAGVLVAIVGVATTWSRNLPGTTLLVLGAAGFALGALDPRTAVLGATAGAVVGVLVLLTGPRSERGVIVAARELRSLVLAGVLALAAAAAIVAPATATRIDPAIVGLAYVAFAAATAIRFGAIPFNLWTARVADAAPDVGLPLVAAWTPAAFATVALTWTATSIVPIGEQLSLERGLVVVVAAASIMLGTAFAFRDDDLAGIVGWSIVADGGFVLLGLAAFDPAAWGPARVWLLALVVSKTAFAGWAGAMRATFGTGRVAELGGWATRAPILAVALLAILVAGVGWPGMAAFGARDALIGLVLDRPFATLLLAAGLASVFYYGRLVTVGVSRASDAVDAVARSEARLPSRPPGAESPEPRSRLRRRVMTWRANRTSVAGAAVLVLGALAVAVSGGGLGVVAAAGTQPPVPAPAPVASGVPGSSGPPVGSAAPARSIGPSPSNGAGAPGAEPPTPSG